MQINLRELFVEWQNNLTFREEFKKNPQGALEKAGYEVSAADLEKIKAMLKMEDEKNQKLDERISK